MKKIMRITIRIVIAFVLLAVGFAAGLPIGQRIGFSTGSEWAIVQADIVAREAGVIMPVSYESGNFRVILRQPPHLYTMAWKLAKRHEAAMHCVRTKTKEIRP